MVDSRRLLDIVNGMDYLWESLLAGSPADQRTLSFNLYQASLAVAIHGCDQVPAELARRVAKWRAGRERRQRDEREGFWTAQAVKRSSKPKSRSTRGQSAFDEVADQVHKSPRTVERRAYRKPRR